MPIILPKKVSTPPTANFDDLSFASAQAPSLEQHGFDIEALDQAKVKAATTTGIDGAIREGGEHHSKPTTNPITLTSDISSSSDAIVVPDATLVADEVNVVSAEVFREEENLVKQRADEIAKQVVLQLRDNDRMSLGKHQRQESSNDNAEIQKRTRLLRIIGGIVGAVVVIVIMIVVIVLMTRPRPSTKSTPAPTPKPTPAHAPTLAPTSLPASPCKDFPCSSNSTIMELLNNASNHTLLAKYLSLAFNSALTAYLSFNQTTLSAFSHH